MKSKLSTYRKVARLPIRSICKQMHMSEEELYNLMKTWISQGILSENHSNFKQLEKNRLRRLNRMKHKLNEEHYVKYQSLKQQGRSNQKIAEILGRNEDKIAKYGVRWYKELREEGLSYDEIKKKTNMKEEELKTISDNYDMEIEQRLKTTQIQKENNQMYSEHYLPKLVEELEESRDFLIMDLEGVQKPDEILEIAVIDMQGNVLLNTLVRPTHHIGWHVSQLTGINDRMASKGIGLYSMMRQLRRIASGKTLLSWGTDYDQVLLSAAMERTKINLNSNFACAQHIHMGHVGSSKQIALYKACGEKNQSHRALDDCKMVLKVLKEDIKEYKEKKQSESETED